VSQTTLLIVEDDEDIRDAIAFILRHAGHEVLEVGHGREALDLIASRGLPDLILLDMNMPIMNGWEFARELRARDGSRVPVVVITAAHDAQRSAEEIGAVGFIGKPFELEALVSTIERHLVRPGMPGSPTPSCSPHD
jgi:CheY-like chemotaxis protein